MGKLLYSETRDNGNCDCVHEDPTQLQNTLTENVPCPCPLNGMVTNNGGLTERYISKTRGVPSMGSTNYGPRGQAQSFRNAVGEKNKSSVGQVTGGDCVCVNCGNGECVGCVRGGELCIPNDPAMRTPSMLAQIGRPRGQRQSFRSFDGIDVSEKSVHEIQKSILGLVSVGVLFFVIGYSYSKGKAKA